MRFMRARLCLALLLALVAVSSFKATASSTGVRDVAIDPDDWRNVYVLDVTGRIWFSSNGAVANTANWNWTELTANLKELPGAKNLQAFLHLERAGGLQELLIAREDRPAGASGSRIGHSRTACAAAWTVGMLVGMPRPYMRVWLDAAAGSIAEAAVGKKIGA